MYASGSCAGVISVTMSGRKPRRRHSSKTSTQLPTSVIPSGSRLDAAAVARSIASSSVAGKASAYPTSSRLRMMRSSTSQQIATPPSMVMARGWFPPMPPMPAQSRIFPSSEPPRWRLPTDRSVSNVPWITPCVPMYSHGAAVYWANIVRFRSCSS